MLLLSVSHRFSECADAIGLGDVRFHDLRHAYATRLLERGVHPKVVSEALGHSSISITMDTYSHVMPSMSRVGPTPSTWYSASDGGNLAATERLRSRGWGRFRC